ncbi:hypothetical protein J6590_069738 [Homalodisca vitripennis]|nr:hypothetical protein J6590_069738 [Homalodisca vitripennis]
MFADFFRRNASHRTISQSSEHICVNTLDNTDSVACPTSKHVCRCFPQEYSTPHYQSELNASHITISQRSEHMCVNTLNNTDSVACPTAETCLQMFSAGMLHTSLSVRALSTYVSTHWIIQTALLVPRRKHVCRCFPQECFTPHYQSEV